MKLPILRSNPEDQILYQTERYNEDTFGYEVPIKEEGDYVLVLKFAEVYFAQSQQKVGSVPSGPVRSRPVPSGPLMARDSLPHCGSLCPQKWLCSAVHGTAVACLG